MFFDVPGNLIEVAQIITLEGQIPVGQATRIENTTTAFHMGIINGNANTGTRYGYFTDYGAFKYQAVNQTLNPCLGDAVTLEVIPSKTELTLDWTQRIHVHGTNLGPRRGRSLRLKDLHRSGLRRRLPH